jgi:hypothetical protein
MQKKTAIICSHPETALEESARVYLQNQPPVEWASCGFKNQLFTIKPYA